MEVRQEELVNLLNEVENGESSALIAYAKMKEAEEIYKQAKDQIKDLALEEAANYPEKKFQLMGFEFEKRKGSTRYSYKNIPLWNDANKQLKEIEDAHKKAFLARQKGHLIATNDGEEIVFPEILVSKDTLIVRKY